MTPNAEGRGWFILRSVVVAIVAVWQSRSLISSSDLIYRHDWAWPVLRQQLFASRVLNGIPWSSDGLGSAAIAPLHHPLFLLWSLLGFVVGAHITLVISVVLALAIFGTGIASCAKRLWGTPEVSATTLGIIAMLGPPFMNKLTAGHLYYLVSLAVFPWVVRLLAGGSKRPSLAFLGAAILVAFAVLQIQLYSVMIVLLVTAGFVRKDVPVWVRIFAIGVAMLQVSPEIWAALGRDPQVADAWMLPRLAWEYNNSSPFPAGLYFLGYSPHYAENALSAAGVRVIATVTLQLGLALAALAFFVGRRNATAWLLGFGWIFCTCLVLGLYGPLSAPLQFLFAHVTAFAVFRELYHFAGIGWASEIILIGAAWKLRTARWPLYAFTVLALGVFVAMWVPASLAGQIASHPVPTLVRQRLLGLMASKSDDRFLLWPAEWPLGPRLSESAGADPLAYPIGMHPVANMYRLSGPLEVAAGLVRDGRARAADKWFAAAGVGTIITEPWLTERLSDRAPPLEHLAPWARPFIARSASALKPPSQLPATCMLCSYAALPIVAEPEEWASGDAFILARDLQPSIGPPCHVSASFSASDPSTGWVDLQDWSWLDPKLAMMGSGEMTWSDRPLAIPKCLSAVRAIHVLLLAGTLSINGRVVPVKLGSPTWLPLRQDTNTLVVHAGLVAIDALAPPSPAGPAISNGGKMGSALSFDWRTGTGGGVLRSPTRWIVLKNSFSPHWKLRIMGGRIIAHLRASGYANAWEVAATPGTRVFVWYDRWNSTEALSWFALAAWVLGLLWLLWTILRETTARGVAPRLGLR